MRSYGYYLYSQQLGARTPSPYTFERDREPQYEPDLSRGTVLAVVIAYAAMVAALVLGGLLLGTDTGSDATAGASQHHVGPCPSVNLRWSGCLPGPRTPTA